MSPVNTARGSSLWPESSGSGAVIGVAPRVIRADAGPWDTSTSLVAEARFYDRGGHWLLIDVRTSYVLALVGGKYQLANAGSAVAARVIAPSAGKLTVQAAGAAGAATIRKDGGGKKYVTLPADADELELLAITNQIRTY